MLDKDERFEHLRTIRLQVSSLTASHLEALSRFHLGEELTSVRNRESDILGFCAMVEDAEDHLSIASTATCIRSLERTASFFPVSSARFLPLISKLEKRLEESALNTNGLPHGNSFTIGLLLPMLRTIGASRESALVRKCLELAKNNVTQGPASIENYPPNGYLTYWIFRGLHEWDELPQDLVKSAFTWCETEFYRQLALFNSRTDEKADAFQLGYNFLTLYRFRYSSLQETVVRYALRTLFDAQLPNGLWEKREPLFVYGRGGDAYCFSFELLTALQEELADAPSLLQDHEENLSRALGWAKRNALASFPVAVWRSGHRVDKMGPESWATAEVYLFAQLYRTLLSHWVESFLLAGLKGRTRGRPQQSAFEGLYQPTIVLHGQRHSFAELFGDRFLSPLQLRIRGAPRFSLARQPYRENLVRSGIFFGPPGTGKTTYVKAIARYLGWPLVILDPSHFASEGFPMLARQAKAIFDALMELEDAVIFFDEMEELVRQREESHVRSFEQVFLTTSLLPRLQDLHDKAASVFFLATNYFASIDRAAKREGRFDFQILVMPPGYDEKIRMLQDGWKSGEEIPAGVLRELERGEHKKNLEYATRLEMMVLIDKISRDPGSVREILNEFEPRILQPSGGNFTDWETEQGNNRFDLRVF